MSKGRDWSEWCCSRRIRLGQMVFQVISLCFILHRGQCSALPHFLQLPLLSAPQASLSHLPRSVFNLSSQLGHQVKISGTVWYLGVLSTCRFDWLCFKLLRFRSLATGLLMNKQLHPAKPEPAFFSQEKKIWHVDTRWEPGSKISARQKMANMESSIDSPVNVL